MFKKILILTLMALSSVMAMQPIATLELINATKNNDTKAVKELIALGAPVDTQDQTGQSALMFAAERGNLELVRALIAAQADVNAQNHLNETALMLAASRTFKAGNEQQIAEELISAKANVAIQDKNGYTALMLAARYSSFSVIRALIEANADVNAQDEMGNTPLIYATVAGIGSRENIVRYLIASNALLNPQNQVGWTALMQATRWGRIEIAKILIDAGADTSKQNADGKSAVDVSQSNEIKLAIENLVTARKEDNERAQAMFAAMEAALESGQLPQMPNELKLRLAGQAFPAAATNPGKIF